MKGVAVHVVLKKKKPCCLCHFEENKKNMQVGLLGLTWEMGCCKVDWAMREVAIGLANVTPQIRDVTGQRQTYTYASEALTY